MSIRISSLASYLAVPTAYSRFSAFLTIVLSAALIVPLSAHAQSRSGQSIEQRMQRLERMVESQLLNEMLDRLDAMQREIKGLRGTQEEQQHGLKGIKRRQRDLYRDIDRRLQAVERGASTADAATAAPAGNASSSAGQSSTSLQSSISKETTASAIDSGNEQGAYEKAFNLLTEGRYEEAEVSFRSFLKRYSKGSYAGNAQYWLGEVYYLGRDFDKALAEFGKVVANYPNSPKRANALLKMGFTWFEKANYAKAKGLLQRVVKEYPKTSAARLASNRLKQINTDGR